MLEYNRELAINALNSNKEAVERALEKIYTKEEGPASKLYEAERYSLLSGGKRIRPSFVIETCKMLGGKIEAALPFACAIEMVHTYSLIHDDLPCMDNDDMRRGKPTNHKVFGEAYATLAGDGLLTDAFSVCAKNSYVPGDCVASAVGVLSDAAGSFGMVKGQVIDLYGEENPLGYDQLIDLHSKKTGALICAAVQLGCLAAGATLNDEVTRKLTLFAQKIGLVFQIVDDILDVISSDEALGKRVGADKKQNKTTFMSYYTPYEAKVYSEELTNNAVAEISDIDGSETLGAIALYLCDREN